jgi:hypothetical protein
MGLVSRRLYRGKLSDLLSIANDEAFFILAWSVRAIQSGRPDQALRFLEFPMEAVTDDISSSYAVHPWSLETLLNELLATPKRDNRHRGRSRQLNCSSFSAIARVLNALHALENADDAELLQRVNVLREMHRLMQRQIEWQRGLVSIPRLFRSGFIYGGDLAKQFFETRNGFSVDQFTLACFALRALFNDKPIVRRGGGMPAVGIDEACLNRIYDLIVLPRQQARARANTATSVPGHIGYKRSIFREYPCVAFGEDNERIHAPLSELVMLRCTTGLFYDMAKGGDNVRNEISRCFEGYCVDLLAASAAVERVSSSYSYRASGNEYASPDALVRTADDSIWLVVECKATRMSYEARFSEFPLEDARRGYEEIAKGVFQIWRFASHVRRGLVTDRLAEPATGIVLTLDTWLTMANTMQEDVIEIAKSFCAARDSQIAPIDQIPITFCPIEELENTLRIATRDSFIRAIHAAGELSFRGWLLSGVHQQIAPDEPEPNPYPFADRLEEAIPWWNRLGQSSRPA